MGHVEPFLLARLVSQMTALKKGSQVQANPARPRMASWPGAGFLVGCWEGRGVHAVEQLELQLTVQGILPPDVMGKEPSPLAVT